MEMLGQI